MKQCRLVREEILSPCIGTACFRAGGQGECERVFTSEFRLSIKVAENGFQQLVKDMLNSVVENKRAPTSYHSRTATIAVHASVCLLGAATQGAAGPKGAL